jgi:hypothetical protein
MTDKGVLTGSRPATASGERKTRKVAVVIPIPNDPDWTIFSELSEDVPIIVVDDSDGKLSPAPRKNVRFFDYTAQRKLMGDNYPAIPHKSAATRNFGHYVAYQEGFDVVVALDYDCRTRAGWLEQHLEALAEVQDAPALQGEWINSVEQPGFYARGYPYEYRTAERSVVRETTARGTVKLNMGVWDNVLDLNGIDKVQRDVAGLEVPKEPGLRGAQNYVALGNIPVCGMNTSFAAELTPAYFFLPDLWIDGWQLSRHDDIWGGYILKKLMDKRGDLFRYGRPVVEHTRQSNLQRVMVFEHYMHLMAREFFEIVDRAADAVATGGYQAMFADFVEEYLRAVARSTAPAHYRRTFAELGAAMDRWRRCFR